MADIEIQGYEFDFKPRTKANIDAVLDMIRENEEKRAKMYDFVSGLEEDGDLDDITAEEAEEMAKDELGFSKVMDPWEVRKEMIPLALDGPIDHLDEEKLTWDQLEEVRMGFIPEQMRLLDVLEDF